MNSLGRVVNLRLIRTGECKVEYYLQHQKHFNILSKSFTEKKSSGLKLGQLHLKH